MKINQVVILAGGKGTRLKEVLKDKPKPLVEIDGKPLLEIQIEKLKKFGYKNFLVLVNHLGETILDFCNSKNNFDVNLKVIFEEKPLGTAGAVINVVDQLEENFLVVYGDTYFEIDFNKFESFHFSKSNSSATLFVHPNNHPNDSDLVELTAEDEVVAFHKYPHNEEVYYQNMVNAALYVINKNILKAWVNSDVLLDFGKDIFPEIIKNKFKVFGYLSTDYIKDCGTPNRLEKVQKDIVKKHLNGNFLEKKQKAVFLDRDGTINELNGHIKNKNEFTLIPKVEKAIKIFNELNYKVFIITNQPVLARGEAKIEDLIEIHKKLEWQLGFEGAYVDKIYFCPHHPDKGFEGENVALKIDCNCRKPKSGMVDKAVEQFNIDLSQSWFIGDTTSDIETANNLKMKSILVETGEKGKDNKYKSKPSFIKENLYEAAKFILESEYDN